MTAPYNHDALWVKAKLFINRAMDEDETRSPDERCLWAPCRWNCWPRPLWHESPRF